MLCQICTLLKSSIHGRPGARSLQDEAQAAIHKQEYDDHIEVRKFFRRCLNPPPKTSDYSFGNNWFNNGEKR
ncbi:unnamed protein product [Pylaiella littoralis]